MARFRAVNPIWQGRSKISSVWTGGSHRPCPFSAIWSCSTPSKWPIWTMVLTIQVLILVLHCIGSQIPPKAPVFPNQTMQNQIHELAKTLPPPRKQNTACDACRSPTHYLTLREPLTKLQIAQSEVSALTRPGESACSLLRLLPFLPLTHRSARYGQDYAPPTLLIEYRIPSIA